MAKTKSKSYGADDIDVHLGLDGVRAKPAMYIGPPDSGGLFHICKEILDNGIDEGIAGQNDLVGCLYDGTYVWVYDQGRGIPIEKHKKTGISTLTTIFTVLHAGGKMREGKSGGYNSSRGTHGVGASVTNALSEHFIVFTKRTGDWYKQEFKRGKPTTKVEKGAKLPKVKLPHKMKKGTLIGFKPDASIFKKGAKLSAKSITDFMDLSSYLHPEMTFHFTDEKGKTTKYHQPEGLVAYTKKKLASTKGAEKQGKPFHIRKNGIDVVLQWSSHDEELVDSFVNGSQTKDGGTHVKGLEKAISDALAPFANTRTGNYRPEDLRIGVMGAINVSPASPTFSGQTKEKLITEEIRDEVHDTVGKELKAFFKAHKSLAKSILARAVLIRQANEEFKMSKKATATLKGKRGMSNLPVKLATSITRDPKRRELFVVEGDSAGGTAKRARYNDYQEVLPLRGKILNVYKSTDEKVFANNEVVSILQAIGYDPSKKSPLDHLRVGRLILLADADEDGRHITALILSLLCRYVPDLFNRGMVYLVDSPLFKTKHGTTNYYANKLADLSAQLPERAKMGPVTRFKGWGEAESSDLREIAFNPETRKLIKIDKITPKILKQVKFYMGDNVDARKELLGLKKAA